MTQLRAGVYGRESKGKSKSVEDQVRAGGQAVTDEGWQLVGTWRDGSSASRHARRARTGWPEVRAAIVAGALDVLVLWETSRGSRTMSEWVALVDDCRDHGVQLHIVSDERTYNPRKTKDRQTLLSSGVDAEAETGRLSDRITRGVATAAAAGGYHGPIPYGYQRVIVGERRTDAGLRVQREQRPDPITAPVAVEIITRVASQESVNGIIRDLTARAIPTPAGGRWSYDRIHKIVRSPAYIGMRRHRPVNGEAEQLYAASWEPIVPKPVWDAANAVLDDPARRKASAPGAIKYLLTVIATSPCGGGMSSRKERGVMRYECREDGCVSIDMGELDEYVSRLVVERLSRPDARSLWADRDDDSQAAADQLRALEEEMAANDAAYRAGEISARLAGIREAELTAQLEDARRRSRPAGVPLAVLALLDAADVSKAHVRPVWDALPVVARREVIRLLLPGGLVVGSADKRLSRWATGEDRMRSTVARVTVGWRQG